MSYTTLETISPGSKIDPKICPVDSDLIAYISNGDLWVYDLYCSSDNRLTHSKTGEL